MGKEEITFTKSSFYSITAIIIIAVTLFIIFAFFYGINVGYTELKNELHLTNNINGNLLCAYENEPNTLCLIKSGKEMCIVNCTKYR